MNHLADRLASPETTPERQSTLDAHIRSRIQSELEHLRKEEENVRQEIEKALEKENLDRERTMAGTASETEGDALGDVKSSAALVGDLEEIRSKVDRFQTRRDLSAFPAVKADGEAVISCYQCVYFLFDTSTALLICIFVRANPTTPLDCWRQVQNFKASVAQVEQVCTLPSCPRLYISHLNL